ncbi:hypothetical protein PPL_04545 [Heterostelium album PN500]|uniref:Carbohydrate binding domain-containing protein n=1 Tax=Heterostelium pallidum (strain ATCC 26659 / Pp 5 / PN500) TaxID=670386 RepID=D3B7V7_HETP5|nr:hypothetical protein PPL_04545 [Heterostelium album PN500]EFA82850.1 hypothetical protein PPL_04545 [Heterostelium album PN500]|eukprot:XP_020434967.1 hypothetical protein PPL_04545 [Heterostelium album PN500]
MSHAYYLSILSFFLNKMKIALFSLLLVALTCLSAVNSTFVVGTCDSSKCGAGQVCICEGGVSHCVLLDQCHDVAIVQTIEHSWVENGQSFTLYRVHVFNYGPRTLKNIAIQTDCTLDPRDQNSVWNIEYHNGFFSLPSYGQGIATGKEFVFGYIDRGMRSPNLFIRALQY